MVRRPPPPLQIDWEAIEARARAAFRKTFGFAWSEAIRSALSNQALLEGSRAATAALRNLRKAARAADRARESIRRSLPEDAAELALMDLDRVLEAVRAPMGRLEIVTLSGPRTRSERGWLAFAMHGSEVDVFRAASAPQAAIVSLLMRNRPTLPKGATYDIALRQETEAMRMALKRVRGGSI